MALTFNPTRFFASGTAISSSMETAAIPAANSHAASLHVPDASACPFIPSAHLWRPAIGNFIKTVAEDAASTWARNGYPLDDQALLAVESAVHGVLLHAGSEALSSYRLLWDAIPYATSHTAYSRLATPQESVASHLNGLGLLRNAWGVGIADRWREADFDAPIRNDVGQNFFIEASPGSHETVAGIDYRLQWEGVDADGKEGCAVVAVAGVVRRRDGFAITLTQGGPRLTELKIVRKGKRTDLLKLAQYRFGSDPRAWLLQDVLKSLRREYGDVPTYWLRAERRAPLYGHVIDPENPPHGLFPEVGRLPLEELRKRVQRSPSPEAARLPAVIRRLDAIAQSLGFEFSEEETWWVRSFGEQRSR